MGDPVSSLIYIVNNKTSDPLYIQRPIPNDYSDTLYKRINNTYYTIVAPGSQAVYFIDMKIGWPAKKDMFNLYLDHPFKKIKNTDTSNFVFSIENKCRINIDGQTGKYIRTILQNE